MISLILERSCPLTSGTHPGPCPTGPPFSLTFILEGLQLGRPKLRKLWLASTHCLIMLHHLPHHFCLSSLRTPRQTPHYSRLLFFMSRQALGHSFLLGLIHNPTVSNLLPFFWIRPFQVWHHLRSPDMVPEFGLFQPI